MGVRRGSEVGYENHLVMYTTGGIGVLAIELEACAKVYLTRSCHVGDRQALRGGLSPQSSTLVSLGYLPSLVLKVRIS
jgi:hypothetical protein